MNIDELKNRSRRGQSLRCLFFWGHMDRSSSRVSESCLNQWFPAPFAVADVRYPTAEHWMMAEKARLFGDDEMLQGNEHKFGQDERLATYLRSTDSRILVEASPMDRIWGIGLAKDAAEAQDPLRWRGLNLLGFAQMEVRARLLRPVDQGRGVP